MFRIDELHRSGFLRCDAPFRLRQTRLKTLLGYPVAKCARLGRGLAVRLLEEHLAELAALVVADGFKLRNAGAGPWIADKTAESRPDEIARHGTVDAKTPVRKLDLDHPAVRKAAGSGFTSSHIPGRAPLARIVAGAERVERHLNQVLAFFARQEHDDFHVVIIEDRLIVLIILGLDLVHRLMKHCTDIKRGRRVEKLELALLSKFFPPFHRKKFTARLGLFPDSLGNVTVECKILGVYGGENDGSINDPRRVDCATVRLGNGSENLPRPAHRHKRTCHRLRRAQRRCNHCHHERNRLIHV